MAGIAEVLVAIIAADVVLERSTPTLEARLSKDTLAVARVVSIVDVAEAEEVAVASGESVEPAAFTVSSSVLWTALSVGFTRESISVEVGWTVTTATLDEVLKDDVVPFELLNIPRRSEATAAAACEVALIETEPEVEVDVNKLLLVMEVDVESMSGSEPAPSCVTVCVTSACACGITKFGAMLIAGCLSRPSHTHPGMWREGKL